MGMGYWVSGASGWLGLVEGVCDVLRNYCIRILSTLMEIYWHFTTQVLRNGRVFGTSDS